MNHNSWIDCFLLIVAALLLVSALDATVAQETSNRSSPSSQEPGVALSTNRFQTRDFVWAIDFSPDGSLVAVSEANSPTRVVRLFRVDSGRQVQLFAASDSMPGWVTALAFSPDGKSLLCGEQGGRVTLWEVKTGKIRSQKKSHTGDIVAVAFSPDGKWWATAGAHGRIEMRRARGEKFGAGRILVRGQRQSKSRGDSSVAFEKIVSLCFSADSRKLVVADPLSVDSITILDVTARAKEMVVAKARTSAVSYIGKLDDANTFLTMGRKTVPRSQTNIRFGARNVSLTQIDVWDLATGKHLRKLHDNDQYGFGNGAVSPDGRTVVVSDFAELSSRDTISGKVRWKTKLPGTWSGKVAYSPDGQRIALKYDAGLALFDASNGKRLFPDSNKGAGVRSATWSNDGKFIATGHQDGFVRIWDGETNRLTFEQELAPVISRSGWKASPNFVAFSREASLLVAAGRRNDPVDNDTGIVVVYDIPSSTQKVVRTLDADVRSGAISPDGNKVVVATSDGSIGDTRLYGVDISSGDILFEAPKNGAGLWSAEAIAFDDKGDNFRVATGNSELVTFSSKTGKELGRVSVDWRTSEQKLLKKPRTPQLWEGAFHRHENTLVTSSGQYLYCWDAISGIQQSAHLMPHRNGCYIATHPTSRLVAISDLQYSGDYGEDVIRLVNPSNGEIVRTLKTDDARAILMRFSPDGTRLFAGLSRGSGVIWDLPRLED